jgi:hypothetical protein
MFLSGLCAVLSLAAQIAAPVQAPPLGADFDSPSGLLYPILGVPGSARLGTALPVGPYAVAAIASQQDFAITSNRTGGQVSVVRFTTTAAVEHAIAGATPSPDKIILSPSGAAAVLWHSGQLKTELVTGLPSTPVLQMIPLTGIQREPDLLAVSDTGTLMAVFNESLQATLERFPFAGAPAMINYPARILAITFLRNSADALLADGSRLLFLRDASEGDMRTETAVEHVATGAGTQIAVSRDNARAMLVPIGGSAVELVELSGKQSPVSVGCACSVQQLTPLRGKLTFLLTPSSTGPSMVVDGSGPHPVFSVIPAHAGANN